MTRMRIGSPLKIHEKIYEKWGSVVVFESDRLVLSLGIGLILALIFGFILLTSNPASLPLGTPSWLEIFIFISILTIGHELLHLLGFPRLGLDSNSVAGIWWECGSPYVQHVLPMQRNRFILACAIPFTVLTLIPLILVLNNFGSVEYLSWISVLNCIGAGSDLFIILKLFLSVPNNAWVLENGQSIQWSASHDQ